MFVNIFKIEIHISNFHCTGSFLDANIRYLKFINMTFFSNFLLCSLPFNVSKGLSVRKKAHFEKLIEENIFNKNLNPSSK